MFASFIFCGKISIAISSDLTPMVKLMIIDSKACLKQLFSQSKTRQNGTRYCLVFRLVAKPLKSFEFVQSKLQLKTH